MHVLFWNIDGTLLKTARAGNTLIGAKTKLTHYGLELKKKRQYYELVLFFAQKQAHDASATM